MLVSQKQFYLQHKGGKPCIEILGKIHAVWFGNTWEHKVFFPWFVSCGLCSLQNAMERALHKPWRRKSQFTKPYVFLFLCTCLISLKKCSQLPPNFSNLSQAWDPSLWCWDAMTQWSALLGCFSDTPTTRSATPPFKKIFLTYCF